MAALQFCEHTPEAGATLARLASSRFCFMFLVDDLLLLPVTGLKFVLRTLGKVAQDEYTDTGPIKEKLLELQVKLEFEEITEQEYVECERQILRELREIENRKRIIAGLAPEEAPRAISKPQAQDQNASK